MFIGESDFQINLVNIMMYSIDQVLYVIQINEGIRIFKNNFS